MNDVLEVLAQFGAGRGDPGNNVVRFLLPSVFWIGLAVAALKQWRATAARRDLCIGLAALIGLCRELLMFVVFTGDWLGYFQLRTLHPYYPPFEHAVTLLASALVAVAFLTYFSHWKRFSLLFLAVVASSTALLYVISAVTWPLFLSEHPDALFGQHWTDMAFRLIGATVVGTALGALVVLGRSGTRVPKTLLVALLFFFLDDGLMIVNLALDDVYRSVLGPIRHNLHIWAILLLVVVYWIELTARLRDVERTKNAMINLSPSMLCIADFTGQIKNASQAAGQITGMLPHELVGRSIADIGFSDEHWAAMSCRSDSGDIPRTLSSEGRYIDGDGNPRWLQWTAQPVVKEGLLYAVVSNITERKQAGEALQRAYDDLERRVEERTRALASTNEELRREVGERKRAEQFKEEYISLISHDLKSPLTVILGLTELLRRTLEKQGEQQLAQSAERIYANGKRMNVMIADLVDSARLESGQLTLRLAPVSLKTMLESTVEKAASIADQARVQLDLVADVPVVPADGDRLERVVVNLLTNALKFSPAEGRVAVKLRRSDNEAVVTVSDQGPGIGPDHLPYIFDRFYRASPSGSQEGLGLGLYISRLIVQAHGGRIWVESEPDRGSSFQFALPILRENEALPSSAQMPTL